MHAGALNCPNCGAAVSTDAPHCPFCSTRLQTAMCVRCHGMMWLGSKFCPHCAGQARPIIMGTPSGHKCPRCVVPLKHIAFAHALAEECQRCSGLWMEAADFDRVCSDAEAQSAASGFSHIPAQFNDDEEYYPRCPECPERMSRQNFARRSGIMINICRAHGVWLDGDELRQVIEFIRAGGMDRARDLEKQQLESARRRLADERRAASADSMRYSEPPGNLAADLVWGIFSFWF
jgi:Zn-finger nucleic acid-binding protein